MKRSVLPMCLLTLVGVVSVVLAPADGAAAASSAQAPTADVSQGKTLFLNNCSLCHGPNGDGKGPNAATLNPPPANFTTPKFWSGDVAKKIRNAVKNGKGLMPPANLKDDEVQAVMTYMSVTFKAGATR